ncbi:unnamed protein product [Schistocephalus solidus]|uniref:Sulfotransferase family n=1 Tax=Schistocephalus solidus TaxID=70667 RepID=A0A0X3NMR3_SCHSO|nr:unnamed protein product [Schistocephalus solidus]
MPTDKETKPDSEVRSKSCRPEDGRLQVIGSGLMRTGTTSLKCALTHLLKAPCYHMYTLVNELREPALRDWLETFKLLHSCFGDEKPDAQMKLARKLTENLRGFASAVDYPACVYYRELMEIYPEAKVILTVRDADDWVASCRATVMSEEMLRKPTIGRRLVHWWSNTSSLLDLHDAMFKCSFGENFLQASDEELKQAYLRWNEEVIATVQKERLLVFNAEDGWKPLCNFLGLEQPVDLPYPHANRRTEMAQILDTQLNRGRLLNCLILILACGMLLVSATMFCQQCNLRSFF